MVKKVYSLQSFYSDQDEAAAIDALAKDLGMSVEVYLRMLVFHGSVPRPVVKKAANDNRRPTSKKTANWLFG